MRIATAVLGLLMVLVLADLAPAEPIENGSSAEEKPATAIEQNPSEAESLPTTESTQEMPVLPGDAQLTGAHDYLSRHVEVLARKIDAFFGTERAFEESSGTYVQARGSLIYQKKGDIDFDEQVRAKVDLPNLRRKFSLVIESQPEELAGQGGRITTGNRTLNESIDNKDFTASLQLVLREKATWDIRLQPGIKLHWPPETFLRLRSRRIWSISENWLSRVTFTPGWYDSRGWEVRLRNDFDREAVNSSLFRVASEAVWLVKEDRNVELIQTLAYSHPLGGRARMAYETGVSFETDPTFWDTSYFSSIRYRRNIHRGWAYIELKPQILFERENNFRSDPSFAVTLEIIFGARYLSDEKN